jgi:cytochrome c-type biogenesis protein CcmH/NrfG
MTPDQLKRMADKKVAPLLQQLNENPNDRDKLIEVGGDYYLAQQFNEAAAYYEKAAHVKQTADILTKLSNAQFYGGSGEKAISTLDRALQLDPKFANALYNLGMLKWQVRGDMKGAIASWEKLLKITDPKNPNRANLEKMVAAAKEHEKMSAGNKKTDKPGM